ncbi:MAG: MoxR family ATPase, partial [Clostridia bacterium]|nr:MoxR family ATPase [Clostridia bacterium]
SEHQATIDGVTYNLDEPFFVIATQNPIESQGTFPLPEAQMDRFLMKLSLGYPEHSAEKNVLTQYGGASPLDALTPVCTQEEIRTACDMVRNITVSDPIKDYIIDIADATRNSDRLRLGVSPRATLAMMRASQAYAAIMGRDYVLPDDVKKIAIPVLSHRIITRSQNTIRLTDTNEQVIEYILDTVRAPIE